MKYYHYLKFKNLPIVYVKNKVLNLFVIEIPVNILLVVLFHQILLLKFVDTAEYVIILVILR